MIDVRNKKIDKLPITFIAAIECVIFSSYTDINRTYLATKHHNLWQLYGVRADSVKYIL